MEMSTNTDQLFPLTGNSSKLYLCGKNGVFIKYPSADDQDFLKEFVQISKTLDKERGKLSETQNEKEITTIQLEKHFLERSKEIFNETFSDEIMNIKGDVSVLTCDVHNDDEKPEEDCDCGEECQEDCECEDYQGEERNKKSVKRKGGRAKRTMIKESNSTDDSTCNITSISTTAISYVTISNSSIGSNHSMGSTNSTSSINSAEIDSCSFVDSVESPKRKIRLSRKEEFEKANKLSKIKNKVLSATKNKYRDENRKLFKDSDAKYLKFLKAQHNKQGSKSKKHKRGKHDNLKTVKSKKIKNVKSQESLYMLKKDRKKNDPKLVDAYLSKRSLHKLNVLILDVKNLMDNLKQWEKRRKEILGPCYCPDPQGSSTYKPYKPSPYKPVYNQQPYEGDPYNTYNSCCPNNYDNFKPLNSGANHSEVNPGIDFVPDPQISFFERIEYYEYEPYNSITVTPTGSFGSIPDLHAQLSVSRHAYHHPDETLESTENDKNYCMDYSNDSFRTATDAFKTTIDSLRTGNDSFRTTNDSFRTTNDPLRTTNDAFRTTNDSFRTTNDSFRTTNDPFRSTNDSFRTTNDPFRTTNDPLRTTNDSFRTTNNSLRTTNDPFRTTNDSFRTTNDSFRTANDSFRTTNDSLRTANDSLRATNDPPKCTNDSFKPAYDSFNAFDDSARARQNLGLTGSGFQRPSKLMNINLSPITEVSDSGPGSSRSGKGSNFGRDSTAQNFTRQTNFMTPVTSGVESSPDTLKSSGGKKKYVREGCEEFERFGPDGWDSKCTNSEIRREYEEKQKRKKRNKSKSKVSVSLNDKFDLQ